MKYKKIIIIGDQGRGKTTLAKKLSEVLNIESHSTDDYYYVVKFTETRDKQESIRSISKNYNKGEWVVEGSTIHLLEPGFEKADVIIYLKHNNIIYQWWILIKRSFGRKDETWKGIYRLLKHVYYKKQGLYKGKPSYEEIIEPYRNKVVELSSFKQIQNFIKNL